MVGPGRGLAAGDRPGAAVREPCPFCNGDGWHMTTEHNPACTGERCVEPCPVPGQEQCENCQGSGYVGGDE